MSKKLSVGNRVWYRFYNTQDKQFYGDYLKGEILEIDHTHKTGLMRTPYKVSRDGCDPVWLRRMEIFS